jgi:DNA-binding NarL/FixJ family response regulator
VETLMSHKSKMIESNNEIPGSRIPVLISAEPGFLRDSLNTILQSFHFISIVGRGEAESDSLSEMGQFQPEIVLIDCSTKHTQWIELLNTIHVSYPKIICLAICDTFSTSRLALENGADEAIINGFTSQDLRYSIQHAASRSQGIDGLREEKWER